MTDLINNPSASLDSAQDKSLRARKILSHEEMKKLSEEEIKNYLSQLNNWEFLESQKITKEFKFEDFVKAMEFVNKIADVAEKEGHHPDIAIHYNKVEITLWTHFISGLSENDFIMAAKIDTII